MITSNYYNKHTRLRCSLKPLRGMIGASRRLIFYILYFTSFILSLVSCDVLDFDVDSDTSLVAAEMALNFDTIYVMRGDTIVLKPTFKPDTLNIKDIYISSSNYDIVTVDNLTGRIEAVGLGWVKLYVESVSARLKDSCNVFVMQPWTVTMETYPYETVFYASVTFNGKPLTEDMKVAAFVGDECRGVGEALNFHGVPLTLLRVGAENLTTSTDLPGNDDDDDDDDDDDPPVIQRERIYFRLYDSKRHWLYNYLPGVDFDGESHGTLSNLYKIQF